MKQYKTKLGPDGRIIIPVKCRKQLHLQPGDELIIQLVNNEMRLMSLRHSVSQAQNLVQKHAKGKLLAQELKKMRQVEFDDE